jgi:predicted transcriptional regulator
MRFTDTKIRKDGNGLFICPYCQKSFKALAYHTRQIHNISAKQLRLKFGLPMNYSLELKEIREKRSNYALEYDMDKQLMKAGQKTRFHKGFKHSKTMVRAISRGHKLSIRRID